MAADSNRHSTIRFVMAGVVHEVRNCDPTRTVLEYLREDCKRTGTKEGCAEGDCGACTVVIGELHEGGIRYRAVNSCIQFMPVLDGKLLVTVEDLALFGKNGTDDRLHPVQRAMVDAHASQCGFCTPGFVMSLFAMYHDRPEATRKRSDIELGLAGNLCRCTGYAPIVRAAEQALTAPREDRFDKDQHRLIELLRSIQPRQPLQLDHDGRRFFTPRSLQDLYALLDADPDATLLAGGTDVGLWVTKAMRRLQTVILLTSVPELLTLADDGEQLLIGAAVSYSDAMNAIARYYPAFLPLLERLGSVQVRNAGTIGGNIANGSPIGDMPPGLIAAGASLVLSSSRGPRVIDLETFFIAYGKQDLQRGECVEQIRLPIPERKRIFATYKVSKRFEQDISAVCGAFSLLIDAGEVLEARVCYGGMAEIPKRANACEQALAGKRWNQQTIDAAMQALTNDFTPISDMRASAAYRMRVAQNLLQRFYLENSSPAYPVGLSLRHAREHVRA